MTKRFEVEIREKPAGGGNSGLVGCLFVYMLGACLFFAGRGNDKENPRQAENAGGQAPAEPNPPVADGEAKARQVTNPLKFRWLAYVIRTTSGADRIKLHLTNQSGKTLNNVRVIVVPNSPGWDGNPESVEHEAAIWIDGGANELGSQTWTPKHGWTEFSIKIHIHCDEGEFEASPKFGARDVLR